MARHALDGGADLINDVSGLGDPEMLDVVVQRGAGIVVSFNPSPPKTGPKMVVLDEPVEAGLSFFAERLTALDAAGVGGDRVILDPGPDLGKSPWATVQILRNLGLFRSYGRPLLLALSRKDFLGAVVRAAPLERDAALFGVLSALDLASTDILRVHDPRAVSDFYALRSVADGSVDVQVDLELPADLRRI